MLWFLFLGSFSSRNELIFAVEREPLGRPCHKLYKRNKGEGRSKRRQKKNEQVLRKIGLDELELPVKGHSQNELTSLGKYATEQAQW